LFAQKIQLNLAELFAPLIIFYVCKASVEYLPIVEKIYPHHTNKVPFETFCISVCTQ
jgi:hypothetical protein